LIDLTGDTVSPSTLVKGTTAHNAAGERITGTADYAPADHTHNYLPLSGGNVSGHVYLTGAKENSSTSNTSQIVFGTSSNNHVAISSNSNALVINPNSTQTTNQIVLYLDKASQFPSGITGNCSSATTLKGLTASVAELNYVDGVTSNVQTQLNNKAGRSILTSVTLLPSAWIDGTYTINISGVTATSHQEILPATNITSEQLEALQGANIQDGGQSAGKIILKAFGTVPTINIPIRVIVRGDT